MLWIPVLLMAVHILNNREEHSKPCIAGSAYYFLGLPVVLYDYFIYSNMSGGLDWVMTQELPNMIFRYSYIVTGVWLLVSGLELIYHKVKPKEVNE